MNKSLSASFVKNHPTKIECSASNARVRPMWSVQTKKISIILPMIFVDVPK